jgi:hypothetical protein
MLVLLIHVLFRAPEKEDEGEGEEWKNEEKYKEEEKE